MKWKNYEYEIRDGCAVVTRYLPCEETDVSVPAEMDGYPVAEIGREAFAEYGEGIERLSIPSSVRRIGDGAFRMCMSLTELVLEEGLQSIGADVFFLTPLTELYLPASVSSVGEIWELGGIAWTVAADSPHFFSDGFGLYQYTAKGLTLAVAARDDDRREYQIAEGTVIIGQGAFAGQETIERVVFPATVTEIGNGAFESCERLSEAVLNEGLVRIGSDAFSHCVSLGEIRLPASLRVLGDHALTNTFGWSDAVTGIRRITAAEDNPVFWTDESALYGRTEDGGIRLLKYFGDEKYYRVSDGVCEIGKSAFRRARVKQVFLPASVKTVKEDAFRECKAVEEFVFYASFAAAGNMENAEREVRLYVPRTPVYRKDEVARLFREDGFDFAGYDRLFDTYLEIPERGRMACCRLRYPARLSGEEKERYRAFLRTHLEEVLTGICARQDLETLADLTECGIFDEQNIDAGIEVLNRNRRTKLLSFLMNYKRDHLAGAEFDFSL